MRAIRRPFTCLQCRLLLLLLRPQPSLLRPLIRPIHQSARLRAEPIEMSPAPEPVSDSSLTPTTPTTPTPTPTPTPTAPRLTTAPKPIVNVKHIRQNPELHAQNCLARNYKVQAAYPARIVALHDEWQARQRDGRSLRERSNLLRRQLANPATISGEDEWGEGGGAERERVRTLGRPELLEEARVLKAELAAIEADEARLTAEIDELALAVPNLTSEATPPGDEPAVLSYINQHLAPEPAAGQDERVWRSHVHIGAELQLLDFAAAGTVSGWGWYYLLNEAAQLEQALVQYALAAATRAGWAQVSPPSMVYGHIAAACGFQPRDANGETQIYGVAQRAEAVLAGTAEIPLAGMKAAATLDASELPARRAAVSRCYRAEAGARGADTKGLYRVHEFTKVELFAWTPPADAAAADVFDELVDLQTEILQSLGLHCRVLEMPSADLGASASRKIDIEAFFPSRRAKNDGWGEVSSASICTDYQTRRLATRLRAAGGKLSFPWTVNGTALAVPRVLAAILENGWNEAQMTVTIPPVLRPYMDGREEIGPRSH